MSCARSSPSRRAPPSTSRCPNCPRPTPPNWNDAIEPSASNTGTRDQYSNYLCSTTPSCGGCLVPCDPVITVAPDCLFFECFSADESSYGCLTVDRSAFEHERDVAAGTTNVDYSWTLYEHFQSMRSYRETRFLVDPAGFEVQTDQATGYREEKIDLPPSWLRGFLQLQAAMSLPMRRVPIGREGLYNILAYPQAPPRFPEPARGPLRARDRAGRRWAVLEPWEAAHPAW